MYSLDRCLAAHIFASFPFLRPLAIAPLCLRDLKRKMCIKSEATIIDRRLNCYFASVQQTILSFVSILYSVFNEHLSSTQDVKVLIYICGASQKRGLFCFLLKNKHGFRKRIIRAFGFLYLIFIKVVFIDFCVS